MTEIKFFNYNDNKWEYVITYKRQKHMYLKVRNNKILVSAPFFMQQQLIEDFIVKSLPKVLKNKTKQEPFLKIDGSDDYVYFLNEKYPLIIKYHSSKTIINFEFKQIVVYTNKQDVKQILLKVQNFLRQESYALFLKRLLYWSEIMKINFSVLKIRAMISKWGVCQPQLKIITLNYKLIHFGYDIIDYVVIHELAHIVYAHHQKDFWALVAQFCPHFRDCQKVLKQDGVW